MHGILVTHTLIYIRTLPLATSLSLSIYLYIYYFLLPLFLQHLLRSFALFSLSFSFPFILYLRTSFCTLLTLRAHFDLPNKFSSCVIIHNACLPIPHTCTRFCSSRIFDALTSAATTLRKLKVFAAVWWAGNRFPHLSFFDFSFPRKNLISSTPLPPPSPPSFTHNASHFKEIRELKLYSNRITDLTGLDK